MCLNIDFDHGKYPQIIMYTIKYFNVMSSIFTRGNARCSLQYFDSLKFRSKVPLSTVLSDENNVFPDSLNREIYVKVGCIIYISHIV